MIHNKDITIDPELKSLLPPLSDEENAKLIESIAKDGFADPIIVWLNHSILVDGHNRHRIWLDVYASDEDKAPAIVEKHFDSRDDVKEFMLRRQLARRNLSDAMRVKIALQLKPVIEAKAKESQKRKSADSVSMKSTKQKVDTRKEVAHAAGVSEDTVRKTEVVLNEGDDATKAAMLDGKTSVNAAHKAVTATQTTGTSPKRQFKPLKPQDVGKAQLEIRREVKSLIARIKRTSTEAIKAMPSLANDLTTLSDTLLTLASEVTEKIGGAE